MAPFTAAGEALVTSGLASGRWVDAGKDKVALAPSAHAEVVRALGADADAKWPDLVQRRFALFVLGLDPDDEEVRTRTSRAEVLCAATIAVAYGLHPSVRLHPDRVRSELLWRVLRASMTDLLGPGPFPMIGEPGEIGTFVLQRLAQSREVQLAAITADLAGRIVAEAPLPSEPLRKRLVALGCARASFAAQVRAVVRALGGRAPIAEVYGAYTARYGDVGLPTFKERLVGAARARELELGALTLPELLAPELRERSLTPWGDERMHFVIAEEGTP